MRCHSAYSIRDGGSCLNKNPDVWLQSLPTLKIINENLAKREESMYEFACSGVQHEAHHADNGSEGIDCSNAGMTENCPSGKSRRAKLKKLAARNLLRGALTLSFYTASGLIGRWRFPAKAVNPSCCNVRFQLSRTITFNPVVAFFETDAQRSFTPDIAANFRVGINTDSLNGTTSIVVQFNTVAATPRLSPPTPS